MSRASWSVVAASFAILCHPAFPLTVTLPEAELSPATKTELEKMVCSGPYRVPAQQIFGYSFPTGILGARVQCSSHAMYAGHNLFAEAECEGRGATWGCRERWLNVAFSIEGYPPVVRLDKVSVEEGVGIVEYLRGVPIKEFSKLWLLERRGSGTFSAETSQYRYDLSRRKSEHGRTYEITKTWLVDR